MIDDKEQDAEGLTEVDRQLAMEIQIGEKLFGLHGRSRALHAPYYASDWNAIPELIKQCVKRGWNFSAFHDTTHRAPWLVKLVFTNYGSFGPDEKWLRRGRGDSLPLALCRAMVAVLDATEETTNES